MEIVQRSRVYDGFYKLSQLVVQDGEQQLKRERFEPGHAAAALVYDTARQVYLLTRQYRVGAEQEMLEIAAGMRDGDEPADATIRREIQEELGYEVDKLEEIVTMWPSPGGNSETIAVFYAEVSRKTGEGGGLEEENEQIEVVELSWNELLAQPIQDAKTLIAVQWARLRG
ncbi:hypothetical protein GCM10023185_18940 [Hymenobacter saemangeumensis]|uniref:GDP-mannose pyrophosphatase n=1 Tax=Hymenobacter saemangeumensis TaxID=1084522 RepID=A0ABP8ICH8_9BACT